MPNKDADVSSQLPINCRIAIWCRSAKIVVVVGLEYVILREVDHTGLDIAVEH
jgi:hypothetical protein